MKAAVIGYATITIHAEGHVESIPAQDKGRAAGSQMEDRLFALEFPPSAAFGPFDSVVLDSSVDRHRVSACGYRPDGVG